MAPSATNSTEQLPRRWLAGVFLLALSALMLEITLTRLFSLVLWYHLAVVSVSVALFGTAVGGIALFCWPQFFERHRLAALLQFCSLGYSLSLLISLLVFLGTPLIPRASVAGLMNLSIVYVNLAVPFFFVGLAIALALSLISARASAIYFSDLVGAGAGCLLSIPALDQLGGPGTVVLAALIGGAASLLFVPSTRLKAALRGTLIWLIGLAILIAGNARFNLLQVQYIKGVLEHDTIYERWNSFSHVAAFPERTTGRPFGYGLSDRYVGGNPGSIALKIDGSAETPVIRFDNDLNSVDYLRYDVSNIVYYLRQDSKVLVIGPGGGRDILAALVFQQKAIDGAELNPLVVQAVRERFGEYAGHLYDDPRVNVVASDGRTFLARSSDQYDIIHFSAVDTWAATTAGAFALSENTLYTQEAFDAYRKHLSGNGILAVSRFILRDDRYGEALRLTGLALQSWENSGSADPARHMIVVALMSPDESEGYVTVLMNNAPFTAEETNRIEQVSNELGFTILFSPFGGGKGIIRDLATSPDRRAFWETYPLDITPPTDNRPFFFQMLRVVDFARFLLTSAAGGERLRGDPMRILPMVTITMFLVVAGALALLFIMVPVWLARQSTHSQLPPIGLYGMYFTCLGIGFMLVEMAMTQRLSLLMGSPTYSLAIVLFTILLASGLGSFLRACPVIARPPRGVGRARVARCRERDA